MEKPARGDYRVFVSEGAILARKRTSGSGTTNDAKRTSYVVTAGEGAELFSLKLEVDSAGEKQMGVIRGAFTGKDFSIGQQGEVLQVVGTAALAGLSPRNLPGAVVVEHQGELPDGRRLLVTRPQDDWSYADFRLFLGPRTQMVERRVTNVARGSTTTITFILDFQEAVAHFPSSLAPNDTGWVKISGQMQPLNVLPSTDSLVGLSFFCR